MQFLSPQQQIIKGHTSPRLRAVNISLRNPDTKLSRHHTSVASKRNIPHWQIKYTTKQRGRRPFVKYLRDHILLMPEQEGEDVDGD